MTGEFSIIIARPRFPRPAPRQNLLHLEINGSKRTSFGNAWTDSDGVTYGVRFMPAYHWETPVRMVFRIVASRLKSRQRLGVPEPVTPPPGYEHVSMDTPLEWGPDQQYVPVTTERRSPPGTLPPGLGTPASAAQDQQPPEKPGPAEKPIQPAAPYSVPLWQWIILTAFAIGLLWKLLRKPS